jgi:integrase
MPRKPNVRYFASRRAFYCQLDGVQHCLSNAPDGDDSPHGPYYLAALKRFGELLAMKNFDSAGDENDVWTLCNAHLEAYEGKRSPRSFEIRKDQLAIFCAKWGDLRCSEVKPWHAEQIIREHPNWQANTQRSFLMNVSAAFTWGVKQEHLSRNPFRLIEMPPATTCARDRIITPEDHAAVLALYKKSRRYTRNIIVALENTGARPTELCAARVRDFHPDKGAIVYHKEAARKEGEFRHKNAAKKDRLIFFSGEALEMVKALVADKKLDDLIFPNGRGHQHTSNSLGHIFKTIRRRSGVNLVAYSYRHTFATKWLLANGSIEVLATLLGNTPEIIRNSYSHIIDQHQGIRAHIERFMASGNDSRPST